MPCTHASTRKYVDRKTGPAVWKFSLGAQSFHLLCWGGIAGPSLVEEDDGLGQVGGSLRANSSALLRELEEVWEGAAPSTELAKVSGKVWLSRVKIRDS